MGSSPGCSIGFSSDDEDRIRAAWENAAASAPGSGQAATCYVLEQCASTQDSVKEAIARGESAPILVVASTQTRARGTRGRLWHHDGSKDLGFSFLVAPRFDPRLLPMAIPVALRHALIEELREANADFDADRLRAKWPNDLLLDGRKLAGILIESADRGSWIVGIGINVGRVDFPSDVEATATSLTRQMLLNFDRSSVLCRVIQWLGLILDQSTRSSTAVVALYEASLGLVGKRVFVRTHHHTHSGVLASVSIDQVRLADGRSFACGEVEGLSSATE